MNTNDTTSSAFHATFDSNVRELMEPVRETLIESTGSCMVEEIIGQLLMNLLSDSESNLSPSTKCSLVMIAEHMGPDWAQVLYRAAVFITKVA